MDNTSFEAFEREARAAGFEEVLERKWPAHATLETHTHPFDVRAVVVQGEMWLGCEGSTRHLLAGDSFTLARDVPQSERYGPEGATYWVARRSAA